MSECRVLAIYPQGMSLMQTIVEGQYYGTKIKIFPHKCYLDKYKIDDSYYWYYDEERIYHIEDSKIGEVVFICIGSTSNEIINKFLEIKEMLL